MGNYFTKQDKKGAIYNFIKNIRMSDREKIWRNMTGIDLLIGCSLQGTVH